MTQEETDLLLKEVGKQTTEQFAKEMKKYEDASTKITAEAIKNGGGVTKEDFDAYQDVVKETQDNFKEIAKKQGVDLAALSEKMQSGGTSAQHKSIISALEEAKDEMQKIFGNRSGVKSFMVTETKDGKFTMQPYNETARKLGPEATITGISGGTSAVTQSVDAASLLRMGAGAPIIGVYRNTPWVFDFVNLINANISQSFVSYWEEVAKSGGSTTVLEGGTKPASFYSYNLVTKSYKKEATIIGVTEEFDLDFPRLESDIMVKGRMDVMNRINAAILANITVAATTYNTAAQFGKVYDANNFDVIAAMAAQVDNATYGNLANAAFMSTFKKYHMGVLKSTTAEYLNRPDVINNINFIGNPDMGADDVIVGDMTNYNVMLRGGFIVKIGYNGTDFAENRFSIVMEQYYYDWIASNRTAGIVKGPSFGAVETQLYSADYSSQ